MQGKAIKVATLTALSGVALALLSACGSGVAQQDYDTVKQQLATSEQEATAAKQEAAAAKQQVTSLQGQLKPAAPQEPKRLEEKITVEMGETPSDMFFATSDGAKGGPFKVTAGKTVGLHFVNKSPDKTHEVLVGQKAKVVGGSLDGYETNLFEKVAADVFVFPPGKKVEIGGGEFEEIEVGPGAEVWLRVVFPPEMKGEWELGCFVQESGQKGHYDQGMKAKLIIQ
ncbi:MAG: hypothetical protein HY681_02095 [Chloroflexi bacterium]|nr:hypothetical protein [Chloroflexota bacterium]